MAVNKAKILKDAQKFISKGNLDKAIVEYEKLVKDSPNDTNTHNSIGDLYLKKGDKEKAIEHFTKAAEVLNKDGFTLKAIALYKKVLNINPEQVDVLMVMGRLNAERGMVGNANDNYLAVAAHYTKAGKRDRVLDVYKALCNLNPDSMQMQLKLAELYLAEGHENEAVDKFIHLAEKKVAAGEYEEARTLLNKAVGKGKDRSSYMRVSAMLDMGEGRFPEALEKLKAANDANPNNIEVLVMLGDTYFKTGEYELAAGTYSSLLEREPDNEDVQKKLIDISIKAGNFETAWQGYKALAETHIEKKEHDKAEKLLKEFLEHDYANIEANQMLADLYGSIGRDDKVLTFQIKIAGLYADSGEAEKARNICNQLLEKNPENAEVKEVLASIDSPRPAKAGKPEAPAKEPEPAGEPAVPEVPVSAEEPAPAEEEQPEEAGISFDAPFEDMGDIPVQDEIPSVPGAESPFGAVGEEDAGFEMETPSGETEAPAEEEPAGLELDTGAGVEMEPPFGESEAPPEEELGGFGMEPAEQDASGEHALDTGLPGIDESVEDMVEEPFGELETTGFDTVSEDESGSDFIADTPFSTYDDEGDKPSDEFIADTPFGDVEETEEERDISGPDMQIGGFEPSAGETEEEPAEKVYDLSEAAEELSTIDLKDIGVAEPTPAADSGSLGMVEEPASFEERLTEVDVYVKYGLFPKAKETLGALSATHPNNPDILKRFIDIDRAEENTESYASHALDLAGMLYSKGMEEESAEVLREAAEFCPGEERITRKLAALEASAAPKGAVTVPAGSAEQPVEEPAGTPEPEEAPALQEAAAEADEMSFAGLGEDELSFAGLGEEEAQAGEEEEVDNALADAMSEADFYAQQGLADEALAIYRRILASNPEYVDAREKYDTLMAEASSRQVEPEPEIELVKEPEEEAVAAAPDTGQIENELDAAFSEFEDMDLGEPEPEPSPEVEAAAEPAAESEDMGGEDFFDLAAELRDEMGADIITPGAPAAKGESLFGDEGLDAAFQEFKRGVEDQVGSEDYETHYNLGIAYKEMGMLDEALAEFTEASRDTSKSLDCASMLGLCYIEKGDYLTAIEHFKKGLRVAGRTREEYLGIKYDMATAYELDGDTTSAQSLINDVFKEDSGFRDVKKRLQRLNKLVVESGGVPEGGDGQGEAPKKQQKDTVKKNKVSYL